MRLGVDHRRRVLAAGLEARVGLRLVEHVRRDLRPRPLRIVAHVHERRARRRHHEPTLEAGLRGFVGVPLAQPRVLVHRHHRRAAAAPRAAPRPRRRRRRGASGAAGVNGFGVTWIVRPCHSNGSPVHAWSITPTYSSRSLPRRFDLDAGHLELLGPVARAGDGPDPPAASRGRAPRAARRAGPGRAAGRRPRSAGSGCARSCPRSARPW